MDPKQKELLAQLMAIEFTAVDLNLYLDTHPDDRKALNDYNDTVRRLQELKSQYELKYGPLCNFGMAASQSGWRWIDEPWPWEINFA
ncbi:MAG: spore coat protein CotJB [Solirubrobacterales bacterium]